MYLQYLLRRLGMFLLVIFLAVTVNFMIPRLMPGDPVEQKLNTLVATGGGQVGDISAMAAAYRARFGLDQPLWRQYINYWWDVLHLDFGYSLANYPETVANIIVSAMPWTIGLLGISTMIAFVVGSLLGGILAWPETPHGVRRTIPLLDDSFFDPLLPAWHHLDLLLRHSLADFSRRRRLSLWLRAAL